MTLRSKVNVRIMNVRGKTSHGERSMYQIWFANVKANRSYGLDTKTCQKPYKFDLEVEGQCRTGIKNVRYFEYLYYVYNVHLGEKEPPPPPSPPPPVRANKSEHAS